MGTLKIYIKYPNAQVKKKPEEKNACPHATVINATDEIIHGLWGDSGLHSHILNV